MHANDCGPLPREGPERRLQRGESHEPSRLFIGGERRLECGAIGDKRQPRCDGCGGETKRLKDCGGLWRDKDELGDRLLAANLGKPRHSCARERGEGAAVSGDGD